MTVEGASVSKTSPRVRWRWPLTVGLMIGSALLALGILSRGGPNPERLRESATAAAQAGRWAEAEALLRRVKEPTPSDWLLRAVVAIGLNQYEAASGYLAHLPADGPLAAQVALATGRVELGRFRARPMEDALLLALKLDPNLAEARRQLVYLYGTQGRRAELMGQFSALCGRSPLTFDLVSHWCIAHQEQIKEPEELRSVLERFVANDPDDRWSRLGLASVYRHLGLLDKSTEVLAPLPPGDPEARAGRAEIEFDRGDLDRVAGLLAEGPEGHARLSRLRGRLALKRHDGPAAVRDFRLSEKAEPNHWETIYGLSQALRLVDDKPGAAAYARRAEAHRALRDLLSSVAGRREPQAALFHRLASACESAGYRPEASAWYRLAISVDPLDKTAQQALFRLSARGGTSGPPSP